MSKDTVTSFTHQREISFHLPKGAYPFHLPTGHAHFICPRLSSSRMSNGEFTLICDVGGNSREGADGPSDVITGRLV